MQSNEMDEFLNAMADVKPIGQQDKRCAVSGSGKPSEAQIARRKAAEACFGGEQDGVSDAAMTLVDPDDPIGFARDGVQHGVYKNLRLGKYQIDARLDLHGHSVVEAKQTLLQFIKDCQRCEVRTALVLHGKGRQSSPVKGMLKSCVAHWLPQISEVLAFHSALKVHGGTGAVYLLLKKGERQKADNRERHQKR
ncbi:DNA-nicking endonuclease, Smr domain [Ferrimonas sediminum]|uniref:DNA-nicking endonuclease, Smr domain n=1 Tax=Ferrimonas sediminum TaxID=718193 RepID=A0A1G8WBJ5_9GAMM|nr:DNA endonuclease SmrA [Ferrimonas sediminum]SDJ75632.1 DNA-nicking endonuclease, Smr domain [Ferrimonas sediminum]